MFDKRNITIETGSTYTNITVGKLSLYFSYSTVVGFQDGCHARVISENAWGPTTGKHLNALDGGKRDGNDKRRLPRAEFEKQLAAVLTAHGL